MDGTVIPQTIKFMTKPFIFPQKLSFLCFLAQKTAGMSSKTIKFTSIKSMVLTSSIPALLGLTAFTPLSVTHHMVTAIILLGGPLPCTLCCCQNYMGKGILWTVTSLSISLVRGWKMFVLSSEWQVSYKIPLPCHSLPNSYPLLFLFDSRQTFKTSYWKIVITSHFVSPSLCVSALAPSSQGCHS